MVVRLRLSRKGTRNSPFYHVVAINDSKPRDARPIEKLGEYDPIPRPAPSGRLPTPFIGKSTARSKKSAAPGHGAVMTSGLAPTAQKGEPKLQKRLEWNEERIRHWLKLGAQPSKPVARMLDRVSTKCSQSGGDLLKIDGRVLTKPALCSTVMVIAGWLGPSRCTL